MTRILPTAPSAPPRCRRRRRNRVASASILLLSTSLPSAAAASSLSFVVLKDSTRKKHSWQTRCAPLLAAAVSFDADASGGLNGTEFARFWSDGLRLQGEASGGLYDTLLCECHYSFDFKLACCDDASGDVGGDDEWSQYQRWTEVSLVQFGDAKPGPWEKYYHKQFCNKVEEALTLEGLTLEGVGTIATGPASGPAPTTSASAPTTSAPTAAPTKVPTKLPTQLPTELPTKLQITPSPITGWPTSAPPTALQPTEASATSPTTLPPATADTTTTTATAEVTTTLAATTSTAATFSELPATTTTPPVEPGTATATATVEVTTTLATTNSATTTFAELPTTTTTTLTVTFLASANGNVNEDTVNVDNVASAFWTVALDTLERMETRTLKGSHGGERREKTRQLWNFGPRAAVYVDGMVLDVEDVVCPSGLVYAVEGAPCLRFVFTLYPLPGGPFTTAVASQFTADFDVAVNVDGHLYTALIAGFPDTPIVGMGSPGHGVPYDDAANTNRVVSLESESQGPAVAMAEPPVGLFLYGGSALAAAMAVLLVVAAVAHTRRRKERARAALNDSDLSEDIEATEVNADAAEVEVWLDEREERGEDEWQPRSSLAALGVASTVATRLSAGDAEAMSQRRQPWSQQEPVV